MLACVESYLLHGDAVALRQHLLPHSQWLFAERVHYGTTQQNALINHWLLCLEQLDSVCIVSSFSESQCDVALVELKSKQKQAFMLVHVYHHKGMIKAFEQWIDSEALGLLCQSNIENQWPQPDPLQLSDFDQQLHQNTVHAKIADLLPCTQLAEPLEKWWSVWQGQNHSEITPLYSECTHFGANQRNCTNIDDISRFYKRIWRQLQRPYMQLEHIYAQQDTVFVRWRIDADMPTQNGQVRVRIPIVSYLQCEQGRIVDERWVVDMLAFEKRFGASFHPLSQI